MSDRVQLVEVGPRDGLQNEKETIATETKIRFIEALFGAGHQRVEVTAFVSPKAVPALSDADVVAAHFAKNNASRLLALVPNERGLGRAITAGLTEIAVFTAASESFNQRNIQASIDESFARFVPVVAEARQRGIAVRGYVSTILHCPYEGRIPTAKTCDVVRRLLDLGCHEVSLGETVGRATPKEVTALLRDLRTLGVLDRCAGHFHDTYGMGVANVLTSLEAGVRVFDSSAGGLGGCPYAPGAAGNVATEDLLFLLGGLGMATGVDLELQVAATRIIEEALQRPLPGRSYRALRNAARTDSGP